jgi:cytochrome c oxidase assembly protein subunit 11
MTTTARQIGSGQRRHTRVALACALLVAGMVGMSFAAVPLYRLYCQVTGFNGTTMKAAKPSETVLDRVVTVRFDANVGGGLAWEFQPVQNTLEVKVGENVLAFYRATNRSDRPLVGTSTFNVTPELAGKYFAKVQCFCFQEQRLDPGESIEMPVSFYIDPDIAKDPDASGVRMITLSYTFYPVTPKAAAAPAGGKGT